MVAAAQLCVNSTIDRRSFSGQHSFKVRVCLNWELGIASQGKLTGKQQKVEKERDSK